jgi:hypothetical protein
MARSLPRPLGSVLFNHVLSLDDQWPILGKPILPRGEMVKQGLGAVVRLPETSLITISHLSMLEAPWNNPPIKRLGMTKQVVDGRLRRCPELSRGVMVEGIDKAVGRDHRQSFQTCLRMITPLIVSHVSQVSLSSFPGGLLGWDERDRWGTCLPAQQPHCVLPWEPSWRWG